jgi:hypothetical protein
MSHIGVWSNNNNLAKTHHCSNLGATYFHILHRPNLASGRGTGLNPFVTLLLQVAFQTTLHVAACSPLTDALPMSWTTVDNRAQAKHFEFQPRGNNVPASFHQSA